jgi:hypothetical protein
MKWIGQHIYDQIARFRNDVYLEDIPASTETDMLVVDSAGKVSKRAIDAITVDVSDFMTNGVDNRVLTATGADAINAEANLTFDGTDLSLAGSGKMEFRDTGAYIHSLGTGVLEIVTDALYVNSTSIRLNGDGGNEPFIFMTSIVDDSTGPIFYFQKSRDGNGLEDGDTLGKIIFNGDDDVGGFQNYGSITGSVIEADHGDEAGQIAISVANDGVERNGITMTADKGTATEVDVTIAAGAASVTTIAGDLTTNGDDVTFQSSAYHMPIVNINSNFDGQDGGSMYFKKTGGVGDGQILGTIYFAGEDDGGNSQNYAIIQASIADETHGQEAGKLTLGVTEYDGGSSITGLLLDGDTNADGEIDVTIAAGAASVTTVAGTLTMGSTATLNNTGILQTAAQTNITSLGTLTALDVDDINLNTKTITITGDTDDTFSIVTGAAGATTLTTVDTDAVAAHFSIVADGNITLNATADIALVATGNDVTVDTDNFVIESAGVSAPDLTLLSTSNHLTGSNFIFKKQRADNTPADGDIIGTVTFQGEDDGGANQVYATIAGLSEETGSGEEGGKLKFNVTSHDGEQQTGLLIEDGNAEDEIDVTIANGAASLTTIAGTLTMGSTATLTNAGLLSVAGQTNITSLGTLTALTVDNIGINGDTITASGDMALVATGNDITVDTDNLIIESATSDKPRLTLKATNTTAGTSGELKFLKDAADVGDGEYLGEIGWYGDNDAGSPEEIRYARIFTRTSDVTDGSEAGNMFFHVASYDGASTSGLQLLGDTNADGEVDVTIASGAASTTTIAGVLRMGSTAALTNAGLLAVGNQTGITRCENLTYVGTIGTGVWQGTAVASAYLDADTAHLTTAQTFTGSKTMGTDTKLNFRDANAYIYSPTANDLEIVATDIVLDAATSITLEQDTNVSGTLTVGVDDAGHDVIFYGNAANKRVAWDTSVDHLKLYDDTKIVFGTGSAEADYDGSIYWDQTDLVIDSESDLQILSNAIVTGDLTVTSKLTCASRTLALSSSTDGDHDGDVVYFGGTTSMTIGKIYHYKSDGTWEIANADAVGTSDGLLGVALGAASDTNGMLLRGMVTLDHDPGAIGDVLYVQSDNAGVPGNATATPPAVSGDCVRIIGYQVSHASNGNIWFNPDNTFVEVA